MGETSSIVSRSPPFSVSTSHSNERRWMSIRFGSSSEVPRRAKVRRWRGASTGAKTAAPSERSGEGKTGAQSATRQDSTARHAPSGTWEWPSRTPSRGSAVCGGALPEGRLRLLAGRKNTRKRRFRQRWRVEAGRRAPVRRSSRDLPRPIICVIRTDMEGEDRRHPRPRLRALEVIEERALGGRLAGTLYVTGAVTASTMLLIPGVERTHWRLMLGLAAVGLAWALACFVVIPWERASPLVSHFSCALGFPITAVAVAATGGSESPAIYYLLFIVGYCAYFYRRREALPYLVACVAVHSLPLFYDPNAVSEGLVPQLLILGPTYLLLGGLITAGKTRLVELRDEARRLSLADPLTGLANRRALIDLLESSTAGGRASDPVGLVLVDLDGFKEANTLYGHPGGDTALVAAADALRTAAREQDMVARLGGDEFAIVARGLDADALDGLAQRVLAAVRAAGAGLTGMPAYE